MSERSTAPPTNALSFDVEHWHDAALLRDAVADPVDHVVDSVSRVLSLLDRYDVSATFFVVGELAREYPDLVARIHDASHELGSHGDVHRSISTFDPADFRRHLERSAAAIEDASGVRPIGFRAPNFSIDRETAWATDVLAASEYRYDSSVFPAETPMYGVADGPRRPYAVCPTHPFRAPSRRPSGALDGAWPPSLVEVPVAVAGERLPVPIAGGFYARALPLPVLRWGIRWLNDRGLPATLYFHPWEFNPAVETAAPRLDRRLVSFYGIDSLERKLAGLLASFPFGPIRRVVADSHPDVIEAPGEGGDIRRPIDRDAAATDASPRASDRQRTRKIPENPRERETPRGTHDPTRETHDAR